MHSKDVKASRIAENDKNLASKTVSVFQGNSDKIDKNIRSYIPQNTISKIPRIKPAIKPNSFLPIYGDSHVYPV